jgi:hypothetical protein
MKNNQRNSVEGSYVNGQTRVRYRGGYVNNKKHGKGTLYITQGRLFMIMETR